MFTVTQTGYSTRLKFLAAPAMAALIVLAPTRARAASEVYVPCDLQQPCENTIQQALYAVDAGGTVWVKAGRYKENLGLPQKQFKLISLGSA